MSDDGRERRRDTRLQAKLGVRYKVDGKICTGTSADLSENGVFIHTPEPAFEDKEVFMHINLGPGEPTIKAVGVVRRMIPAGIDSPGMGVEFRALYGIDKSALLRFLKVSMGREIDEDAFGDAGTDDMLKFVFEPDEDYAGASPPPDAEAAAPEPLDLARTPVPRPPRWSHGSGVAAQNLQSEQREVTPPGTVERRVTQDVRSVLTERDRRNLAELHALDRPSRDWYFKIFLKWLLLLGLIAGGVWGALRIESVQIHLDRLFNDFGV